MSYYEIPNKFFFRLHHARPRFKNDVESVLLFMATEISRMAEGEKSDFNRALNDAIRLYPGNNTATDKTINNWRTEISSLFGLIEYDGDRRKPSKMANLLNENQDLIEFFRYFLYYFQYPGGHLKSQESAKIIQAGIKFKPARYLIEVMMEGTKLTEKPFGITKAEATHCIFNDLRITRDGQSPKVTAEQIITRRKLNTEYDNDGDVTRYAGDILDYMELGDLVRRQPNYRYYLNMANVEVLQAFVDSTSYFEGYDAFYGKQEIEVTKISGVRDSWFKYVNNKLYSNIFEADVLSIIGEGITTEPQDVSKMAFIEQILTKLRGQMAVGENIKTKEIGDVGEAVVIEHEKNRLIKLSRNDLIHLVQKIPERMAVGYDIGSYEGIGALRRLIEVKTTVSRNKVHTFNFHMTPSEWSAADSFGKTYFIYRLTISSGDISLFTIQDPVGKYKSNLIEMAPRDGADIRYTEKAGVTEELLV